METESTSTHDSSENWLGQLREAVSGLQWQSESDFPLGIKWQLETNINICSTDARLP